MNSVSVTRSWTENHPPMGNPADFSLSTGMSFEDELRADLASVPRAYAFNELGMFGTQRALDMPVAAGTSPTLSPAIASSPIMPSQTGRAGSSPDKAALTTEAGFAPTLVPEQADEEAQPTSANEVTGDFSARARLTSTVSAAATAREATIQITLPDGFEASPRMSAVLIEAQNDANIGSQETDGCAAFVEPKGEATPSTENWLALHVADGLASLVVRDMGIGDQDTDQLTARVEDTLAEHGLGLSKFTLNGAKALGSKMTRKGA